eukprot:s1182_g5.t1
MASISDFAVIGEPEYHAQCERRGGGRNMTKLVKKIARVLVLMGLESSPRVVAIPISVLNADEILSLEYSALWSPMHQVKEETHSPMVNLRCFLMDRISCATVLFSDLTPEQRQLMYTLKRRNMVASRTMGTDRYMNVNVVRQQTQGVARGDVLTWVEVEKKQRMKQERMMSFLQSLCQTTPRSLRRSEKSSMHVYVVTITHMLQSANRLRFPRWDG